MPYRSNSRVPDIILAGGQIRADAARDKGAIWGNAISGVGNVLGGYIEDRAEQKKAEKEKQALDDEQKAKDEAAAARDGAFVALSEQADEMDPQQFKAGVFDIYGPEKGIEILKGLGSVNEFGAAMSEGRRDDALAAIPQWKRTIEAFGVNSPMGRQALATGVTLIGEAELFPGFDLTPDFIADNWETVGPLLDKPEELKAYTLRRPDGEEFVVGKTESDLREGFSLGKKPDTRSLQLQLADARARGDKEAEGIILSTIRDSEAAGRAPVVAGSEPEQPKLAAGLTDTVARVDQALSIGDALRKDMQESWLGPFAGRATELSIKTPGIDTSEKLARFYANTATLKNATIKAITGAQMSEGEAARIMQQVPDFSDKPAVWREKLAASERNLKMLRNRILDLSGRSDGSPNADPLGLFGGDDDPLGVNR